MRKLREAREGDALALRELLEPHVDGVWSICSAMMSETDALATVGSFQEHLRTDVEEFTLDRSFGTQLYAALWATLCRRLDARPARIPKRVPTGFASLEDALASLDDFTRLVFVFRSVTGISNPKLAQMTGSFAPVLREHHAFAAKVTRNWPHDALELAAPEGLLDLVQVAAREVSHGLRGRRTRIAAMVTALLIPTLVVLAALWSMNPPTPPYAQTHALVHSPGAWIDPSHTAELEAAYAHSDLPRSLWVTPDLSHIGLREVGVVVLPEPGTAVIYEDDRDRLYTLQRTAGEKLPNYVDRTVIGGIPLRYTQEGKVSIVAYAANGAVHVTTSTRPVQELMDLVEQRLSSRR